MIYTTQPTAQAATIEDARRRRAGWEARAERRIERTSDTQSSTGAIIQQNAYISAAYAEMYLRDPQVYVWAGMAALTSATVGRGMYYMRLLKHSYLGLMIGLLGGDVRDVLRKLGAGNLAVFTDLYWQHIAYDHAGIAEMQALYAGGALHPTAWRAWQQIEAGRRTGNAALVWAGNTDLLYFEQKDVLQPAVYAGNPELWKRLSGWIGSPIPGQYETFEAFAPRDNLGIFEQRWRWIEHSMLPRWRALAERHPQRVERMLHALMLGGAPFIVPGVPLALVGRDIAQARTAQQWRGGHFAVER